MNVEAMVLSAKTPRLAIQQLARAIDRVESRLAALEKNDPWDDWDDPEAHVEADKGIKDQRWLKLIAEAPDDEARALLTSMAEESEATQARMREVAGEDPDTGLFAESQTGEEAVEVLIPAPDEAKWVYRRDFALHQLKLNDYFASEHSDNAPEGFNTWAEVYAKGGPYWLYVSDRECVMSFPMELRAAMVQDVLEDNPRVAAEMGRDILKQAGEDGPGGTAMGPVNTA